VLDSKTSIGIDLGDPKDDFSKEPTDDQNEGRVNMGRYGNTPEASKGGKTTIKGQSLNNLKNSSLKLKTTPNPFTSSITISYTIQKKSPVSITIRNMQGKRVATLTNKVMQIGKHSISWNANDYPAGIYTLSILSAKNQIIKTLIYKK
jgi:flagellar hook assembly protein FlgD